MYETHEIAVLVVGAGPTGLALAIDLARRKIPFRLVETESQPFEGSRGKGLQPRTLEVFDDLGVVAPILASGAAYPRFHVHLGPLGLPMGGLAKPVSATADVPYPNLWMVPQFRTEQILRQRLEALGGRVEQGTRLVAFSQADGVVTSTLEREGQTETLRTRFLVGCDGGHSVVRKTLGLTFEGEALEQPPVVIADVELEGLDRSRWHVWPLAKGCMLTLCPLPGTPLWQLAAPLKKKSVAPPLTEEGVRRFVEAASKGQARVTRVGWSSLFRPHVRMVDRSRVGGVFVAGDAAHVHPPAGGQGLNTGVQDAYNLGWKLAAVLEGAPDALLDTYEAERLPIAAAVLGLAKRLHLKGTPKRGKETQQLNLTYRGGPLAKEARAKPGKVQAGDRAPDAQLDGSTRLFDVLRGPHFTVLAFGDAPLPPTPSGFRTAVVRDARAWDARPGDLAVVRPDGYIGAFVDRAHLEVLDGFFAATRGWV